MHLDPGQHRPHQTALVALVAGEEHLLVALEAEAVVAVAAVLLLRVLVGAVEQVNQREVGYWAPRVCCYCCPCPFVDVADP
jgi:hypothetical protein